MPTQPISVLAALRALVPVRPVTFIESLKIAELQANRLLEMHAIYEPGTPSELVTTLPYVRVVTESDLPVSGSTHWNGDNWIVAINASEPLFRQRLTLFHEFKHIIDHPKTDILYHGHNGAQEAEQAADYFAGCVLVSKRLFKRAWYEGNQTTDQLSQLFGVSTRAAEVRLAQLGLEQPAKRCAPQTAPSWSPASTWRPRTSRGTNQGSKSYNLVSRPAPVEVEVAA